MPDVSRRSLLAGLGTLGIAAAVSSTFTTWAQAAPPLEGGDWESLRSRWVEGEGVTLTRSGSTARIVVDVAGRAGVPVTFRLFLR